MIKQVPFRIPQAIITGVSSVKENLLEQAKGFKAKKVLIVSDNIILKAGYVEELLGFLADPEIKTEIYTDIEAEPSIENMEMTLEKCSGKNFDLFIGIGGGSVMDTTKMLAALLGNEGKVRDYVGGPNAFQKRGAPTIMIPTTSGTGAEVTVNVVFTDKAAKLKRVVVSQFLMPDLAIIDPMYTLTVPAAVTAATGMDALTHAIEAYTALKATPISDLFAQDAIRRIGRSLRTAVAAGENVEARWDVPWFFVWGHSKCRRICRRRSRNVLSPLRRISSFPWRRQLFAFTLRH